MRNRKPSSPQRHPHHNDDTAPFDVAAFLVYLNDEDHWQATVGDPDDDSGDEAAAARHNDQFEATIIKHNEYHNIRTHYYGDNCPGGHYNDLTDSPDDYTSDAYYDGYDGIRE